MLIRPGTGVAVRYARLNSWALTAAALATLLASEAAFADQCASSANRTVDARAPVTMTGVLRRGRGQHPARGRFTYYYIELASPVCVANVESLEGQQLEDHDGVRRLQIMNPPRPRVGRPWSVTGTISVGHTAWHVEELLLLP